MSCTRQIATGRQRRNIESNGAPGSVCSLAANPDLQIARMRCKLIANSDDALIPNIDSIIHVTDDGMRVRVRVVDQVPACPPISALAIISPEFPNSPNQEGCFRSMTTYSLNLQANFLQRPHAFASVCCYNEIG